MLAHNKEGKVCLEDADGRVVLDFSKLVSAQRSHAFSLSEEIRMSQGKGSSLMGA